MKLYDRIKKQFNRLCQDAGAGLKLMIIEGTNGDAFYKRSTGTVHIDAEGLYNLEGDTKLIIDLIHRLYGVDVSDPYTNLLFNLFHEFAHGIDKDFDRSYYGKVFGLKVKLASKKVTLEEAQEEYRLIPEEARADKWALNKLREMGLV